MNKGSRPSTRHMEGVRCIVKNAEGNYFPKATLAENIWVERTKEMNNTAYWAKKYAGARAILMNNGLSGELYNGVKMQAGGGYDLPIDKRWLTTSTGSRKQQVEYVNPLQAGVDNENILLFNRKDGTIKSFDITRKDPRAGLSVRELEEELGGQIQLKSEKCNGYHSVGYLDHVSSSKTGGQDRYNSQVYRDVNPNGSLPKVGIIVGGRLFNVDTIFKEAMDRENSRKELEEVKVEEGEQNIPAEKKSEIEVLADLIKAGDPSIAPLIRIRSRKGGYHTAEHARQDDPTYFNELMPEHKIPVAVADCNCSDDQIVRDTFNFDIPTVLIDTGDGYLEDESSVIARLGENETILSKYKKSQILVTNIGKDGKATGFYGQIGILEKDNGLGKVHPHAMKLIQMDREINERPDLVQGILTYPSEEAHVKRGYESKNRSSYGRS
ncbi:hypothetical protein BC361_20855 [Ensifer sp. LC54]|nr:hypothetical protein BC363_24375 [Ensifer sp. LC384]OCP24258.1 hypothetical protein BC361_20855 [Ensifer sp. LC54]